MNLRQRIALWLDPTPERIERELFELTVKAGRRCAYDLRHAADWIDFGQADARAEHAKLYSEAARMWLGIFDPANGPKDYRHDLHREIERLWGLCQEHGIDPHDGGIPF